MPKRSLPSVADDFAGVLEFFKSRGIITQSPAGPIVGGAKKLHRATYTLILWRFRLKKLPAHGQVFIEEIASDALQILPQALMGYGKTTKLLTRGIIENTLRHLYFSDHPVEFARMNREKKWYLSIEDLIEYLMSHPTFLETEPKFDAVARLRALYGELSAGVHGRRVQDLEMRIALNKIAFDEISFRNEVRLVEKCAEAVNFLVATFHKDKVRSFQQEDRQTVLHTMSPRARQVWAGLA
jgi:hypothetical protein